MKFEWKCKIFNHGNAFENVVCENGGHFVQGEMSWKSSSGVTSAKFSSDCKTFSSFFQLLLSRLVSILLITLWTALWKCILNPGHPCFRLAWHQVYASITVYKTSGRPFANATCQLYGRLLNGGNWSVLATAKEPSTKCLTRYIWRYLMQHY